jgi:hypothetical protein
MEATMSLRAMAFGSISFVLFGILGCSSEAHPMEGQPQEGQLQQPDNSCGDMAAPWDGTHTFVVLAPHMNQWASRQVDGTCEMGTYSKPVTLFGKPQYAWALQTGTACPVASSAPCGPPN